MQAGTGAARPADRQPAPERAKVVFVTDGALK
jgi:hypothetical protein